MMWRRPRLNIACIGERCQLISFVNTLSLDGRTVEMLLCSEGTSPPQQSVPWQLSYSGTESSSCECSYTQRWQGSQRRRQQRRRQHHSAAACCHAAAASRRRHSTAAAGAAPAAQGRAL